MELRGALTALVTPMTAAGLDESAFARLIEWQLSSNIHGLVPCGTTGESPTLTHEEHRHLISLCVKLVASRVPVIAGCGSNNTQEAIDLVRHAEEAGANASLVVTPYYNKPTQEGLYAHFSAVAKASSLPMIIYNIPPRSVVDMSIETMTRLVEKHENIVGVKDSTCDLARPALLGHYLGERSKEFIQLSGEDGTALAFMAQGGRGCISVTANVAPRECAMMFEAWQKGDVAQAMSLNRHLTFLHEALFVESNPAPVKYLLNRMGYCENFLRPPLLAISNKESMALLDKIIKEYDLA